MTWGVAYGLGIAAGALLLVTGIAAIIALLSVFVRAVLFERRSDS